ncbi:MAG: hypothetical protein JWN22_568 [Nocardioides sp.]|nr:hypothetical protein [Nocardioides sp.]
MSEFAFSNSDMGAAQAAATGAAGQARGADGADALNTLAAALPGTSVAAYLPELAGLWETGIRGWGDAVELFAEGVATTAREGTATDSGVGGLFGGLFGGP